MIDWKKIRSYGDKLTGEERERYDRLAADQLLPPLLPTVVLIR